MCYSVIIEANLSTVTINQCDTSEESNLLNGTNKCHHTTNCAYKLNDRPFASGNYWCTCKLGYYSIHTKFDGALVDCEYS